MRVIKRSTLIEYGLKHPETKQPLLSLYKRLAEAEWLTTQEILNEFSKVKIINAERARFAICGGNYRVINAFQFYHQIAWIKFVGTHKEYDQIDAKTVSNF